MKIEIAQRLAPFSHEPGIFCLIPHTSIEVQAFPTLLRFKDLLGGSLYELPLPHKGPVNGFTLQLDLERARVRIFGHAQQGYFCSHIMRQDDQLLFEGAPLPFSLPPFQVQEGGGRLSFGVHKEQDMEKMRRRLDPLELWPFWLRLSQLIPKAPLHEVGSFALLAACAQADKVDQHVLWQRVILGGTQGILSPRYTDEKHQGLFAEGPVDEKLSPLGLLHKGAELIRALFFKEEQKEVILLGKLPPECHAGRFTSLKTVRGDCFDIEWSKKSLKKAIIRPAGEDIHLGLQKGIRHFRLRRGLKKADEKIGRDERIQCSPGETLYLDRFEY